MHADMTAGEMREKTAQLRWTAIILAFFLIQAIIWTVAFSITARDPSHAVVDNYDEKALNWDEQRALRQASAALGWTAGIHVDDAADIRSNRIVTIEIKDGEQRVPGSQIELTAFHRARAGEPQQVVLKETAPGVYSGILQVRHSGLWQFTGIARHDDDTFLFDERQHLEAKRGGQR
ncbi:MAG: FixH family protein [Pirellulaceae bacterium]